MTDVKRSESKSPQVLVAACSCHSNVERRTTVRETWGHRLPRGITLAFFVGEGPETDEPGVIHLPVSDGYDQVAWKVQAFFRHALAHFEFDYLFKCDEDTYVETSRLLDLAGEGHEFIGSRDLAHLGYAQGGAGYLLSRRAVEVVALAPPPYRPSEDIWVSLVVQGVGIPFHTTTRLRMDRHELPRPHNDIVTAHWCSPQLLRLIHEGFANPGATDVIHFFLAQHPDWWGPVKLLKNRVFLGRTGDPSGSWMISNDGEILELHWDNWAKDVLRRGVTGFLNTQLRLDSVGAWPD